MVKSMRVLGIDIVRGSPLSRTTPPYYSAVIIDENGLVYEAPEIPLKSIIRLILEYKVNRIGLDNIYEIAPTSKSIARILGMFPADVEIYQVTIEDKNFVSLVNQALKIGLDITKKPRPLQTAYICALLALNGIGTIIRGKERKTKIIISKARSVGSGGSSANRFARGMRTAILRATREIKYLLDKASLNYDLVFRRGSGGLDSAVFIVYSDYKTVRKVIKPFEGNDVRIIIKPEYTTIEFVNEKDSRKRPIIVGIDPGMETGIAIIDLSLQNVFLTSSKELDRMEIINLIYNIGIPALIATDKNPPPESVKKIASTIGVPLYIPSHSLSIEEKERLVEIVKNRLDIDIKTVHERDALAAALKAYKTYEKKFIELERKLMDLDIDIDIDEMKLLLLQGKTINEILEHVIETYIESTLNGYGEERARYNYIVNAIEDEEKDRKIRNLENRVKELLKEREVLRNRIHELEQKLSKLEYESKFKGMPINIDDIELNKLRERIKQLQNTIDTLLKEIEENKKRTQFLETMINKLVLSEYVGIPKLRILSVSGIMDVIDLVRATKVILLEEPIIEPDALKLVKELNCIIILQKCEENLKSFLLEHEIPTACNLDKISEINSIVFTSKLDLDSKISEALKEVNLYREKLRKLRYIDSKRLLEIIDEYRKQLLNGSH
ncbi:Protein of unknown function DUF460 [Ignisphaera aggregans DSM 17230]|uniref:DUF460 domain-containing protein n=1 Tax=Ignisphaera aggregans (strain DSM 17230 / JCM 13409 / AQ1.S1) TaxID=583356 RepID=E0SR02_IGNAA|nr:Protein of unknown function DUF460 [Ignisphaera aggregans DSM 17230]